MFHCTTYLINVKFSHLFITFDSVVVNDSFQTSIFGKFHTKSSLWFNNNITANESFKIDNAPF